MTYGNTFWTRISALFLAILILLGLIACGSGTDIPVNTDHGNSTDAPADEDPLAGLNFKGETFTIHSSVNVLTGFNNSFHSSNYLIQGEDEDSADKAAASALQRNKLVESNLNVRLNYIEADYDYSEVIPKIREMIKGGLDEFQLIINDLRLAMLSTEGLFHDVSYGSYFDFSKPYWYDDLMDSVSLKLGTRYALMGDYFIDIIRFSNCLLFSKSLYEKLGCDGESIYQVVRDGDWTLDKLYEIIKGGDGYPYNSTFIDRTGNKKRDRRDTYGLVLYDWWGPMIPILVSTDPEYIKRNSDGYPELNVYNERTLALTEKLLKTLYADEAGIGKTFNFDNDDCILAFTEDRALILGGQMLGSLESSVFADSEVDFAILPYPKLDDLQKDYVAPMHDTTEVGFIPSTVSYKNLQVASAVIESLNRETEKTVIPKYYESTLKIRYARESANAEMIQLIHDHYAAAFPLAWDIAVDGYLLHGVYESVYTGTNTFSSYCRMYEGPAQTALSNLIFEQELVIEEVERQYYGK
ncbi:MAG: hypothetical protein IJU57_06490 [Clostridia bacterium]|nr:hypothetical protein [Clostridia bacterium]